MLPLTSHQKKNKFTHYSLSNILDLKYSLTDGKLSSLSSSVELKNFSLTSSKKFCINNTCKAKEDE